MLLMMAVLTVGASLTSCGDIVIGSTDTPAPNPDPTPTPTPKYTYTALTHPLTFEATQPNVIVTFKFKEGATPDYRKVEYSLDGQTWTPLSGPNQPILLANTGDSLMFRGQNPTYNGEASFELIKDTIASARANTRFPLDNQPLALIYGNLVSLLRKDLNENTARKLVAENKDAFKALFKGAKIDVKKSADGKILLLLPTTLAEGALMQTFANSLITALELPATVLQKDCYTEICLGCEYLEEVIMLAEELPDNVTVDECLKDMLKDAGGKTDDGLNLIVSEDVATGGGSSSGADPSSGGSGLSVDDILNASGAEDDVTPGYMDDEGNTQNIVIPEDTDNQEDPTPKPEPEPTPTPEPEPTPTAGEISYATTTVNKLTTDAAFTNTLTKTGDGKVTYSSDKETVATVDENGLVTIKGAGEATITATVADSDTYTYAEKTATYKVTVTEPTHSIGGAIGYEEGGDPTSV